jgi:diaminohydroxyphosphoribosylaminopyrimidine deaminase/5-amino-6-(5-phosphoribosylamino)uracil reductase
VAVGIGTVLTDDPRLAADGSAGRQPARVVFDTDLRTPPGARLVRDRTGGPAIVVAGRPAPAGRRRRLEESGALVLEVGRRGGRVDFAAAVRALGRIGIRSLLIEGGSEILGAAIDARLADRAVLFVAPRILGGRKALPVFGGGGVACPARGVRLEAARRWRSGGDLVVEGRLRFPAARRGGR